MSALFGSIVIVSNLDRAWRTSVCGREGVREGGREGGRGEREGGGRERVNKEHR